MEIGSRNTGIFHMVNQCVHLPFVLHGWRGTSEVLPRAWGLADGVDLKSIMGFGFFEMDGADLEGTPAIDEVHTILCLLGLGLMRKVGVWDVQPILFRSRGVRRFQYLDAVGEGSFRIITAADHHDLSR